MFDKNLIRKINRGRCIAFVGSGPSCEIGYPSWHELAKMTYEKIKEQGLSSDNKSYEKYLDDKKYAELFRQVQRDLGDDKGRLIKFVKPLLSIQRQQGAVYDLISRWPFACYLTTNYDDEIEAHLARYSAHFTVVRNRQQDFHQWRDGVSHYIQKLHSDLDHPGEVVLTSTDYERFYSDDAGLYFRERLCDVFKMFDIFIIGHSLSDPDIEYVLRLAREKRDPGHPIYMAAANFTKAEEEEYLERYNIVLVRYANPDGNHSELRRMLNTTNRFIASRQRLGAITEIDSRPEEEVEAAIAVFLYRRLQGVQATDYLGPLILSGLDSADSEGVGLADVASLPVMENMAKGDAHVEAIEQTMIDLSRQGLVSVASGIVRITGEGHDKVEEFRAIRETERDQAYGQFQLDLKQIHNEVEGVELEQCRKLAEEVIVTSFESRGSMVAKNVFFNQMALPETLSDVFGFASDKAAEIRDSRLRAAFIEAMHQFLVEPNVPQQNYLASVSQGYFLYHLLGLSPKFNEVSRDVFQKTLWFCDSSVILPLIAVGCHNHEYAVELFRMLKDENALLYTTSNLLQEAWEHYEWALRFIKTNRPDSLTFLSAALVRPGYKQNLFVDGYIRLSANGQIGTLNDYLELVNLKVPIDQVSFESILNRAGIRVIDIADLEGFVPEDWGEIEYAKAEIQREREERGNYRAPLQVDSEAEVWMLLNNLRSGKYSVEELKHAERVYFVSQSRILDRVFQEENAATWAPEALYRYLSALPGRETNPALLQQCMLHEYYYAGISFIDKDSYRRFFGPTIDAAKASYQKEKAAYIKEIEHAFTENIDEDFEKTPDLEKPFFAAQVIWQLAEASEKRSTLALQRALEAERKVKQLESEKATAWKKREDRKKEQETATLRNLQDPKHVRQRQRQAKKRKRNKK